VQPAVRGATDPSGQDLRPEDFGRPAMFSFRGFASLAWRFASNVVVPVILAWGLVNGTLRLTRPVRSSIAEAGSFGAVTVKFKLPGTAAGIPEPIFVYGRAGNAALVYIRLLQGDRAKIGLEFWGKGAFESAEFPVPALGATLSVACYLPSFFPREGDSDWGNLSPAFQKMRRSEYLVAVDGVARLRGPIEYPFHAHPSFYAGLNPFGGSLVSDRLTGFLVSVSQAGAP
jgi:hypothetical protein